MTAALPRRAEWLLGRIAAKDAVRALLRSMGFEAICPADIEIATEEGVRPVVAGRWPSQWGPAPHISIAHKSGRAVAFAGSPALYAGVGIDLERIEERPQSFFETAFTERERLILSDADDAQRALLSTRFWCAKEAVGKALGRGLEEILTVLEVQCCRAEGRVRVGVRSSVQDLPEAFVNFRPVDVFTTKDDEFLIALVAIPLGM
jgi:phosphopantetheine--protein transferase-like protein